MEITIKTNDTVKTFYTSNIVDVFLTPYFEFNNTDNFNLMFSFICRGSTGSFDTIANFLNTLDVNIVKNICLFTNNFRVFSCDFTNYRYDLVFDKIENNFVERLCLKMI